MSQVSRPTHGGNREQAIRCTQPNINQKGNNTMKTTTPNSIIATARGVDTLLPMLTGQQSVTEWAQSIAADTVVTKTGREISAARAALNGAQFAMTNIAMAMRSATELGMLPYTQAVRETKRIYTVLDALRSGFAAVREEAHRELTVAEITLAVKDGAFDSLQSEADNEPYTEEELLDMGLGWEDIQDVLESQARGASLSQSHLMDSDGSWSEGEGEFLTSVHDATQLWDMQLQDIKYSENAASRVALIGMEWPTHNPMWDALLDRLADAWQAGIEYADDKEAAAKKVERREQVLDDLRANPTMARWVINHVTRRMFRDMTVLELKAEDAHERLAWVERQAMNEERYGVPANLTRKGTGEQAEYDRKAYLMYLELDEAEVARNIEHDTQVERDRCWIEGQLEAIDNLLAKLRPLYSELRQMDLQLSKLWELFTDGQRPAEPPVYWNMEGAIFDADQAKAAIRVEMAMARAKYRAAEGDALAKAAAMVEAMLGL